MDTLPYKILLIEPNMAVAQEIIDWLKDRADITHVTDKNEAKVIVSLTIWDLIITDLNTPKINDLDITELAKKANPITSVLIVTEDKKVDFIIAAMQNHADWLMFKPLEAKEFVLKAMKLAHDSRTKRLREKKIILAIGAHPDDVEFGCGGALAKHNAEGDILYIATLSSGEVGGDATVRKIEAEEAAKLQNAHLFMGNFVDTDISHSTKTIHFIENIVQQINPTHIYTHSYHDTHQDHRSTYNATITACRSVSNIYCYLSPSSTLDFKPNIFINIDSFLETKIKMLAVYSSQSTCRPYLEADLIRATARYWGRFYNYHLVEPIEVIKGHL